MPVSPYAAGSGCGTVAVAVPVADEPGVRVASAGTWAGSNVTGSLEVRARRGEWLVGAVPGLAAHGCSNREPGGLIRRLREDEGTWLAHVAEHVALEIQGVAGSEVTFGRTRGTGIEGQYNLVYDYRQRDVVLYAGLLAIRLRMHLPPAPPLWPAAYELARVDASGVLGVVHLDVRRQIERPATAGTVLPGRIAAWRDGARRGWLIAAPGASDAQVLEAGSWRVTGRVDARGEILALAASGDRVLVVHATRGGVVVSPVDAATGALLAPLGRLGSPPVPLRVVAGSGDCVALLDRDERWLAGFVAPPLR